MRVGEESILDRLELLPMSGCMGVSERERGISLGRRRRVEVEVERII